MIAGPERDAAFRGDEHEAIVDAQVAQRSTARSTATPPRRQRDGQRRPPATQQPERPRAAGRTASPAGRAPRAPASAPASSGQTQLRDRGSIRRAGRSIATLQHERGAKRDGAVERFAQARRPAARRAADRPRRSPAAHTPARGPARRARSGRSARPSAAPTSDCATLTRAGVCVGHRASGVERGEKQRIARRAAECCAVPLSWASS